MKLGSISIQVAWICLSFCTTAAAQITRRTSLADDESQGNGDSGGGIVSADGRYVTFWSLAPNLVPGDTNGNYDAFLRDRWAGATERVSVDSNGIEGNTASFGATVSSDGRFVAFQSQANNFFPGDSGSSDDVFLRDRTTGTTQLVSISLAGAHPNGYSQEPWISSDGRFVVFQSTASNLVVGDSNGAQDIFVRDVQAGTTELVSVDSNEMQGNFNCWSPTISADGRYVVFHTFSTNWAPGDTNNERDVYVRDRGTGTTELVSVGLGGLPGNAFSGFGFISADGRCVVFESTASDLVAGDTNGHMDIFLRDRQAGSTVLVSVGAGGVQGNADSEGCMISADGHTVAFGSAAGNLVPQDTNGFRDAFVRDLQAQVTERVNVRSDGLQGNNFTTASSITADGRLVVFTSHASNLIAGDTNGKADVFEHDRNATGFTSVCDPGMAGVISCPCSNPPSGPGRGCNNSAATGGAVLAASGVAYLTSDSLLFTTDGERATATSILLQGTTSLAAGLVYGQGVRCVGGALKRLYTKTAFGGSIDAPDVGAGDPTVSARSAALGDAIQAGQSRWYLVFYRDPIVLGGCPAANTFNATQTGRVAWSL